MIFLGVLCLMGGIFMSDGRLIIAAVLAFGFGNPPDPIHPICKCGVVESEPDPLQEVDVDVTSVVCEE